MVAADTPLWERERADWASRRVTAAQRALLLDVIKPRPVYVIQVGGVSQPHLLLSVA